MKNKTFKQQMMNSITDAVSELDFLKRALPQRTMELEELYEDMCERLGNVIREKSGNEAGDAFYNLTDIYCGIAGDLIQEKYYAGIAVGLYLHNELKGILNNPFGTLKEYFEGFEPFTERYTGPVEQIVKLKNGNKGTNIIPDHTEENNSVKDWVNSLERKLRNDLEG